MVSEMAQDASGESFNRLKKVSANTLASKWVALPILFGRQIGRPGLNPQLYMFGKQSPKELFFQHAWFLICTYI